MKAKPASPKREIELDFIRGVAILLVLNFHYQSHDRLTSSPFLLRIQTFGWIGVDIFFVLSGFLVGGLMLKEWRVTGKVDALRFLKRRAFKIWPSYYLFLLVAAIAHVRPWNSFLWQNLLNIQNYIPTTLSHTWSLAVEEHFYLGLAALIALCSIRRWRVSSLLIGCIATALAVEALRAVLILTHRSFFFYTHTRIDALLLGVALAILRQFYPEWFARLQRTARSSLPAGRRGARRSLSRHRRCAGASIHELALLDNACGLRQRRSLVAVVPAREETLDAIPHRGPHGDLLLWDLPMACQRTAAGRRGASLLPPCNRAA